MNELAVIETKIKSGADKLLRDAASLQVVDQESSSRAQAIVATLKGVVKDWRLYWKEPKEKAKAAHAALCARENELLERVEPAIKGLSDKVVRWTVAEREKARIEQEAREKAEWEARQREEKANAKLEQATTFEEAAEALEEAKPTTPLPPEPVKPKLDQSQLRDHWVWEVEEFDKIPRLYLIPDPDAINDRIAAVANKTDESVKNLIPGIRVFNRPILATQFKRRS